MKEKKKIYSLSLSAIFIALSILTNQIKIIHMPLGGSVTLFSMLFATLIGFYLGPKWGLSSGLCLGILNIIFGGYIYHPLQVILDYILSFSALGLSGFFKDKKHGLVIGYIVSVFVRFIFSTISGYVFFSSYAPEGMNPLIYSILYQLQYLGIEGVITVIVLLIPSVNHTIYKLQKQLYN